MLTVQIVDYLKNSDGDKMNKLVVIDTETGGLDANKVSILSVGAVVLNEKLNVIDKIEIYVKEDEIVAEDRALQINKIDLNWLKINGHNPYNAVLELEYFLSKHFDCSKEHSIPVAGHNIGFDINFMKRLYRLAGKDYEKTFSHRTLDTSGIINFLNLTGNFECSSSSDKAFAHFKIVIAEEKRHTALGDALATAELLRGLVDITKIAKSPYPITLPIQPKGE